MAIFEKIFSHQFFEGMSGQHRRVLEDHSLPTQFAANELIFREGDPVNRFYLIENGRVALEAHVRERGTVVVDIIKSGDVSGRSWLFSPCAWHFDARALEEITALFYGMALRDKCERDPALGYQLMQRTSKVLLNPLQATRKHLLHFAGLDDVISSYKE